VPLVISTSLPAGVTLANGNIRVESPDLETDLDIEVFVHAKDLILWPLLVVFAAVMTSRSIRRWVEVGRASQVNAARIAGLTDDLENLATAQPAVGRTSEWQELRRQLSDASRLQEEGESAKAAALIETIRQKLDALLESSSRAAEAARAEVEAPRVPAVALDSAPTALTTSRLLRFRRVGTVADGASVGWQYAHRGAWRRFEVEPIEGTADLFRSVEPFREPGLYAVRIVVDGQPGAATLFTIVPSARSETWRFIGRKDWWIEALAMVLTALISVIAIDQLDHFGTLRDYVLQFAGVFGLTESVKGFAQTFASVRGPNVS
jgi:hypothetical protein